MATILICAPAKK